MFNWIFKPIARAIKTEISKDFLKTVLIDTLNDEETQKFLVEFTDTLYIRYSQKAIGSLSKMTSVTGENVSTPNIMNSKGQINLKGLIPMFLQGFLANKGEKTASSGGLP